MTTTLDHLPRAERWRGFGVPGRSGQNIYEMYNREPLPFRIYAANGELRGRTLYAEDAAPLLSLLGDGATLHHDDAPNDAPVWIESRDGYAADSYDTVADLAHTRLNGTAQ